MKIVKSITNCYHKLSIYGKALIFIVLLLIVFTFFKTLLGDFGGRQEGFITENSFLFKDGEAVYDDFYANVYDHLVFNQIKNDYEVGVVINGTFANETSVIADIGCGTGHQVKELSVHNMSVIGIDKSPEMVQKAKENYPNLQFKVGDALQESLFKQESLTHILCLYFTLYYMKNKRAFFRNCMQWLMPGGYLIVHLVDRYHFQPLRNPSNPLYVVNPGGNNTVTRAKVAFDDFVYNANYKMDVTKDVAIFEEKFKFQDGTVRKQEHQLYMEDVAVIVGIAQNEGLLLHAKINMADCGYEHEYLYVFVKPS